MAEQFDLYPTGLTRFQFARLTELTEQASEKSITQLQADICQHLDQAAAAHASNRIVNLRLATAISETMNRLIQRWDELPANARNWLAGAFLYFAKCNDDEPDFSSPIGFEDDAEVLNACLRYAKLNEMCLRVEDYDGF